MKKNKLLVIITSILGAIGAIFAIKPFILSWMPSHKASLKALPIEVDISHLKPGERMTVNWRGKPIWVIRRTESMINTLASHIETLKDPFSFENQQPNYAKNALRSIKPEYLVLVGRCTHLGCIPNYTPKPANACFFCPCHSSVFDCAGRVLKGMPAPTNLEVPAHYFTENNKIVIGRDKP